MDTNGQLFASNGDANNNGILDLDESVAGPDRVPYVLENTGLNRMFGNERNDNLFVELALISCTATEVEILCTVLMDRLSNRSMTGWPMMNGRVYARESDQVWYVGGSNAADKIDLNFVTEPGLLTDHHLLTRLTNNNGNFSFAAQIRLDFEATDADGNKVWNADNLKFRVAEYLATEDVNARTAELSKIATATSDPTNEQLLASLIPPEGDFQVILIDALGGNDQVTVGPTVQKSVWIDAGAGDDQVEILAVMRSWLTRPRVRWAPAQGPKRYSFSGIYANAISQRFASVRWNIGHDART